MDICKELQDSDLLHYVEKSLSDDKLAAVETHLSSCRTCMAEVLELNRINAMMSEGKFERIPAFITLRNIGQKLADIATSFADYELVSLANTRDEVSNNQRLLLKGDGLQIQIYVAPDNRFWIVLVMKNPRGAISLRKMSEKTPLFYKETDAAQTVIKGVDSGVYELCVADEKIRLELQEY